MNKIIYILGIVIMWAAWAIALYLIKDETYFKAVVLVFLAAAVGFGYVTLILISKALK